MCAETVVHSPAARARSDLDGQFPRWDQDQHLHSTQGRIDALEQWQDKGERLSGTRTGLADHVLTGQEDGDGLRLDGGGLPDALRIENAVQGRWQRKVGERRHPSRARHDGALTPWTRLVAGQRMTLVETVSAT